MSRRTEHEEDVIINQEDVPLDDDPEPEPEELFADDIEEWESWHQDHLLNMYFSLKEYCEVQGLRFMDRVSFHQLCEFLYANYK
jgi:uncharacterized protein (DUF927 family)